jgi:hypothetical protein
MSPRRKRDFNWMNAKAIAGALGPWRSQVVGVFAEGTERIRPLRITPAGRLRACPG